MEGEIEAGKRYTETDFNKIIEIKEREAHRVKLFMEQIKPERKNVGVLSCFKFTYITGSKQTASVVPWRMTTCDSHDSSGNSAWHSRPDGIIA